MAIIVSEPTMDEVKQQIESRDNEHANAVKVQATKAYPVLAWASLVCAMCAWVSLMLINGNVAFCIGAVAVALGVAGAIRNHRWLRHLAVSSTIASLVLVVVIAAFLLVIKVSLGV
ncbi:MAG: hypothetical protein J1F05_08125 [Muribaculaceae bacterium]|nr:hypothetical protein [Muribaculaceae bacterium]